MERISLQADMDALEKAREFTVGQAESLDMPFELVSRLELVLEEALVNVVKHAYSGKQGVVELTCGQAAGPGGQERFLVEIRDSGPPFDPLAGPTPNLDQDIEERPIGGLGIHLMRNMTEDFTWERQEPQNVLRLAFAPRVKA